MMGAALNMVTVNCTYQRISLYCNYSNVCIFVCDSVILRCKYCVYSTFKVQCTSLTKQTVVDGKYSDRHVMTSYIYMYMYKLIFPRTCIYRSHSLIIIFHYRKVVVLIHSYIMYHYKCYQYYHQYQVNRNNTVFYNYQLKDHYIYLNKILQTVFPSYMPS